MTNSLKQLKQLALSELAINDEQAPAIDGKKRWVLAFHTQINY